MEDLGSHALPSLAHFNKVLIEDILDVDMCLRIQNLKKIANLLKNKGIRAISIKGGNKNGKFVATH